MATQPLPAFLEASILQSSGGIDPQIFLWLGTILMFVGMVAFIFMGWGEEDPKKQEVYVITIMIPAIAFTMYLSMALGFGVVDLSQFIPGMSEEFPIYWARYTDWILTTPLLLLDLGLLAGATRTEIGTLVGLDVMMIVTGIIAAVTTSGAAGLSVGAVRLIWWGISTAFMVVLLFFLVSRLTETARQRSQEAQNVFSTLRNMILVLWSLYPVVWILGTEGTIGVIPLGIETALFMVLDVTAKVGFGFVLLRSRAALDSASTSAGADAAAAD